MSARAGAPILTAMSRGARWGVRSGRLLLVLVALPAPAPAGARAAGPEPLLYADTDQIGTIGLYAFELPGSQVRFYERAGGDRRLLGVRVVPAMAITDRLYAGRWRCARRLRRFEAVVRRADGTTHRARYSVRTPPCAQRLWLRAPRRAAPGSLVSVRVRDAWRLGDVAPLLCVRPPAGRGSCRRIAPAADRAAVRRVRLLRDGRWRLSLRLGRAVVRRTVLSGIAGAGGSRRPPTVLVTGDSTVQNLDAVMAERLRRSARVVPAWRGGSTVGGADPVWPAAAAKLVRRRHPRLTIVSAGASEGFPIAAADGTKAPCCGPGWQAAYAAGARRMMEAFAQDGRGQTLWLLLPAMRDPRRRPIIEAVNAATTAAAAGLSSVTLVHVDDVISPGGTYRRSLRYRGRTRVIRQPDGIHLTVAGARIVGDLLMRTLGARPQLLAGGRAARVRPG